VDKKILISKLKNLGIEVTGGKVRKKDIEKVLSKYKVQASEWQESNLVDLGVATDSKADQAHPVMYKEVTLLYIVGKDEATNSYRYDVFHDQKAIVEQDGMSSARSAMDEADRLVKNIKR